MGKKAKQGSCERDCERELEVRAAMPRAASDAGVRRRVKRETALVFDNDLDATLTGRINDPSALF